MLHTKDLQPVRIPAQLLNTGSDLDGLHVLAIGADQVLGGGTLQRIPQDDAHFAVMECWGVSDLTEGHWMALTSAGGVRMLTVPAAVGEALRSTLERFSADGIRRIDAERARRSGVLDAVRALGETFPGATLSAAAIATRNGGQRGTGSQ